MNIREISGKCAAIHRTAWSDPNSLEKIVEVWRDKYGYIYIRYSCGDWYHYNWNKGHRAYRSVHGGSNTIMLESFKLVVAR